MGNKDSSLVMSRDIACSLFPVMTISSTPTTSGQTMNLNLPGLSAEHLARLAQFAASLPATTEAPSINLAGIILSSFHSQWIVDSGATHHACSSLNLFSKYYTAPHGLGVLIPDGTRAPVTHIGTVVFSPFLTLTDVYYIPSFKYNLISVSKLSQCNNIDVIFSANNCSFQDRSTKNLIGQADLYSGLYQLRSSSIFSVFKNKPFDVWHCRLGHPSGDRFRFLLRKFSYMYSSSDQKCVVCPMAKQSRLPFNKSTHFSTYPFQLIHCDIWGPFSVPSLNGDRFFLTIVDDYTRCTWVFLMKVKSETLKYLFYFFHHIIKQYKKHVHTISSGSGTCLLSDLQTFRSDNGSEFLQRELQEWFAKNGIIHQRSCVSTPQQNGVVERKHRHLLDIARALRFQSNLPLNFWGECLLTAAYLINKMPTPTLHHLSPHEKLLGTPPDYNTLRVFGCLCFVHNTKIKHKFDMRASPSIFLGYPYAQKGYIVYNLETKMKSVSRHVTFHENIFPYDNTSPTTHPDTPPTIDALYFDDIRNQNSTSLVPILSKVWQLVQKCHDNQYLHAVYSL